MDLLSTKLLPPPPREKRVERAHLLRRLGIAPSCKLTLICAPAGYGKTTLLSHWVHHRLAPVGWLTIDRSDNDLAQFLRYFLAAIQRIDPAVGTLIPGMLQPPKPQPTQAIWITLINDIAASGQDFLLILDDYQEVDAREVHEALNYLIEHLPDNLHLVISTRADPPINLPKLRARGELLELRAADLCFTSGEAKSFFYEVMDLPLSQAEVDGLVYKAEGWIAGLQIAGMMLRNQPDLPQAVRSFTGSHRHILDYLAIEVIDRLSKSTQEFLCQTAILDDLEASLCDAVTGRSDSQQTLEQLERENRFIVPLDSDRRWYRYHRLMAEVLRRRIENLDQRQLAEIHRRASTWYEARSSIDMAIEHAFKAGDIEHAAELIAFGADSILKRSQTGTLLEWLGRLPEELLRERPRLNLAYAWALLLKGGSVQAALARLEAFTPYAAEASVLAEEAVIRAMIATLTGDVEQGLVFSRRALQELPSDSIYLRSIAADNLGIAHVLQGDIELAIQAFKESSALARDSGSILFAVASSSNLGGLYLVQGHYRLAETVYRQALELATTSYNRRLPVACRALMGLGEISREWNYLEQARALLEQALQLSQQYSETGELLIYLSLSRVFQTQGAGGQALELIIKAQNLATQSTASRIDDRLVEAALSRLWLQQGNISAAVDWSTRRGFEKVEPGAALPEDHTFPMPYELLEAEWMVYARLQLAQNVAQAALLTLNALLTRAQNQHRARRLNEILVLAAIAYQRTGAADLALASLASSLDLAEPEGCTRVYIDEGPPLIKLLREAARRDIHREFCNLLIESILQEQQALQPVTGAVQAAQDELRSLASLQERELESSTRTGKAILVEPLSERELQVLNLLAEGCTNREISERLYISLSTVKGHVANISGKMLARNRTEAVTRARHLGILPAD